MRTLLERLLEVPAGRREMAVILLIGLPWWGLMMAWDIMFSATLWMYIPHATPIVPALWVVRHMILLPLLLLCYFLSCYRRLRMQTPAIEIVRQLLLAAIFSILARPATILASALLHGGGSGPIAAVLNQGFSPAGLLAHNAVFYSLQYLCGLALIWLVNILFTLYQGKLAEEHLRSLWLTARLGMLRNQLNPHFFFNCLHTISALIRVDVEKADRMIADVSDLMRYALRENRDEFCTVGQEIDYIRRYIRIEQIRFEDRLGFALEAPSGLMQARIPSLILQPLVENAIKHGVAAHTGADAIRLEVATRDSSLLIRIANAYVPGGADEKRSSMGIGLQHVRERLATIYGAAARLEAGADGHGTWQSALTLPLQSAAAPPVPAAEPVVPA